MEAEVVIASPIGAVYTKQWAVNLVLGLAGYEATKNLVDARAVEPSAGEGAFLLTVGFLAATGTAAAAFLTGFAFFAAGVSCDAAMVTNVIAELLLLKLKYKLVSPLLLDVCTGRCLPVLRQYRQDLISPLPRCEVTIEALPKL